MQSRSEFVDSVISIWNDEAKHPALRRTRTNIEAFLVVFVLVGAGAIGGYWARDHIAVQRRAAMEQQHRADLAARDKYYSDNLKLLAESIGRTTGKVEAVAEKVEGVAQSSEVAVDVAKKAASTATKAVANSNVAIGKANAVPESTREQVQRSVEKANSKVAK